MGRHCPFILKADLTLYAIRIKLLLARLAYMLMPGIDFEHMLAYLFGKGDHLFLSVCYNESFAVCYHNGKDLHSGYRLSSLVLARNSSRAHQSDKEGLMLIPNHLLISYVSRAYPYAYGQDRRS